MEQGLWGSCSCSWASERSEKPDSDEVFPHGQGTQSNQPG